MSARRDLSIYREKWTNRTNRTARTKLSHHPVQSKIMPMRDRTGFLSYVHADDQAEGGRIKQLASDLGDQYAMISGEPINIFVDRDDLVWGDNWREKIDASLNSGLFFIPVITPRFFESTECRRELQTFVRSADSVGARELILPLVYVNVPSLSDESPGDEAAALIKTFQWEDWRDLRFEDRASGTYRRGVARLAQRLVDANQRVIAEDFRASKTQTPTDASIDGDEEELGLIDLLALGEEAMPRVVEAMNDINSEIVAIGNLAQEAAEDMQRSDQEGKGFAAKSAISKRLAQDLSGPADRILTLANTYSASLYDADRGVTTLIRRAPEEVKANPSEKSMWVTLAQGITQLATTANQGIAGIHGLAESIETTESMSRDLRPVARKIRQGLTIISEGAAVINEWKRLVDQASAIIESTQDSA